MLKRPDFSPAQPWRLFHPPALSLPRQPLHPGTRLIPSKAATSEEARRYVPHFVWAVRPLNKSWRTDKPLQCLRKALFNVEPLRGARTPPGEMRVSARLGLAGEKNDFFSILLDRLADLKNRRLVEIGARRGFGRNVAIPVEHPTAIGAGVEILCAFDF